MSAATLEEIWTRLEPPADASLLNATSLGDNVWAAIDHLGQRHLLLLVPEESANPTLPSTRGLQAVVARHRVAGQEPADYLDLVCLAAEVATTFSAVAADVVEDVTGHPLATRMTTAVAALGRWQWFWGVDSQQLSDREALGLFGELWFMRRWSGVSPESVEAWNAVDNARHDFQWRERSVEVKTSGHRTGGAVVHRIAHLDQLADPESGTLYLFSLRIVRDELARNTLAGLVETIGADLGRDPVAFDAFSRKLAARGYNPAHRAHHEGGYRILGERLYEVRADFPRLTSDLFAAGLPSGVGEVSYTLDMAACDPWLVTTTPDAW